MLICDSRQIIDVVRNNKTTICVVDVTCIDVIEVSCTDNDTTLNNLLQCGNDNDSGMSLTVKLLRFDIIRKELRRKLLTNSKTSTIRPKMASIIKRKRKQSHPLRLACLNKKKKKETTK